ncbi:PSD1 and planctomycete cytochrome C domain-containing protein [Stieleria neptunia]|nr:PSD1 and planctomycete cytochrome C domain-containing protein [Stieleria neptunia]
MMIPLTRVLLTFLIALPVAAVGEDRVDFNRDIRPILSENCLLCHGPDESSREADLRLDSFDDATDSGAIVPGESDQSEFVRRITSDDPDEIMPPPDSEKQLSAEDVDLLRRWIDQGAEYQQHWAWRSLERPEVPAAADGPGVSSQGRAAAAIDALLASGWAEQGASPVPIATPRERLRRLSYDLRGLPPTAAEVAAFEQDPTERNFVDIRDRWMSQLAYAEHQAVRWLDLVRWADTSGFVSDEPIASGAYRAWVINAFDQNMPFDQFSIEQLAGDLLPDPSDDQLVASGYNRIVNTNCEAGAIEKEQLYKLKGEHVRALGTVWMGMTTGCAECHDHKFDPFSAKDYYSLAAFFDDLVEAGVYTPGDRREPLHYVHDDAASARRDRQLAKSIDQLKQTIADTPIDDIEDWEDTILAKLKDSESRTDFVWVPAQIPAARVVEGSFSVANFDGRFARQTHSAPGRLHRHHAAELMTGYLNPGGQKTDETKDAWYVDVWIDEDDRPDMIGFQVSNGDYGRLGWNTANYETYYWGDDTSGELAERQRWSDPGRVLRLGDLPQQSGWVRLRVPFSKQIPPVGGKTFERCGMAWLHSGGRVGWGDSGLELRTDKTTALALGETAVRRWWQQPMNRQVYQSRTAFVASALKTAVGKRTELQREIVIDAFREQTLLEQMAELRSLESELFLMRATAMPVLVSQQARQRKTTRLLNRGDYQDESGPIVAPAYPEFLNAEEVAERSEPLTRLDLARWLFSDAHPLVARVAVNRLWHQFFGRGLSETLEDSGTQGDWPSNVALLDWLACEFRDSGWDRDHMVRLLTSTQAYQLSSIPSEDLRERDPGNRWHARQSRFRLNAESIRDSALHAAGLLRDTEEIPTESFFPYQPDPYWSRSDKVMYGSRHMLWETSPDAAQYDRSLYTFWKRQNIHPTMLAFDAPTRQECTAKRNITNTPGQALSLLNDPIFVEAARVLAMRICDASDRSDRDRIESAFVLSLQRRPSAGEIDVLEKLLAHQRAHYRNATDDAQRLVSIGQSPPPSIDDAPEIAAWTAVARAILNLHEFLTRS